MTAGIDAKVICVPAKDPRWAHIQDLADIPEFTVKEIQHFFEHYKDLEPGKWVKIEGWGDAAEAEAIVQAGIEKLEGRGADAGSRPLAPERVSIRVARRAALLNHPRR